MKTQKSPEGKEVTPSKKLKQGRLPFKVLSDVSPAPEVPKSRKRKLSAPEAEPVTKLGKIANENGLSDELVVISDDDSKDGSIVKKDEKPLNPFVKLVDTAWKKKLQKKTPKKSKKGRKISSTVVEKVEDEDNAAKQTEVEESMEVDPVEETKENSTNDEQKLSENNHVGQSELELNKATVENNEDKDNDTKDSDDSNKATITLNADEKSIEILDVSENSELSKEVNISNESLKRNKKKQTTPSASPVTPKRSARNKGKNEDANKLNSSLSKTKSIESSSSEPSTPQQSSITDGQEDVSMNETNTTNLTPKQLQKKLESAKKKEERDKERLEREKKKQQEKEEKTKQRLEKEELRKREREEKEEAKKKEKEEKEEQKKKEKEERERQKELEKKLKEEKEEQKRKEREEKEEQRKKEKEAREEERRKKQEAQEQERKEQEEKKKKAAEAFVNFFVPKQKSEKDQATVTQPVSKNSMLSSFTIKADMRLAPTTRVCLNDEKRQTLDSFLVEQNVPQNNLYIKSLKKGLTKPLCNGKTWPLSDKDDDDVMIVEDELPPIDGAGEILTCDAVVREKLRPKLLSFHENRRPPYWGTWRKKSAFIKARQPFKQDQKQLDYEVDSDEDWEEEQEGESIDGSAAGSEDEQDADEYEVDNEVFVPHGYLSDEEATMDEDDVLSLSPETQKARLKHLEDEFETEMKKPTEKLKPRLYGLLWETSDGGKPEKCVDALWNYFGKFSMIMDDLTPLLQPSTESEEIEKKKTKKKKVSLENDSRSPKNEKKKKVKQENKEVKKTKIESKKNVLEVKNQPGINSFLTKLNTP